MAGEVDCKLAANALGRELESVNWKSSLRGCWVCSPECSGGYAGKVIHNTNGDDSLSSKEAPVCYNGRPPKNYSGL